ncbi:MAG: SAM-dependent methyltransferase [Candidatus Micrarchaeota archaeon]
MIDSSMATQINEAYYKENVELPFLTEARGKRYPNAFAHFLYLIIEIIDKIDNSRGGTIKVVELGARGIYFEKEVYSNLRNIDKANNTNVAENIEYVVVDISPVAIEAASKQYKKDSSNLFTTRFVVADVLNKRELSSAGSNNFMVVLNELIDDLPQMVVTRKGNSYYEILYKPIFDPSYGRIRLTRNDFRKLSDEEANMLADYESRLKSDKLEEGYAITYSPVLDKLIENISMLLSPEGRIFVHDYFIRANIPLSFADNLRRIYGYNLGPSALYSIENNKVQITADVNLQQLVITLDQKGFEAQAMPHRFFINEYLGIKEISLREIAASLNATSEKEKRALLERISKHVPSVNTSAPNINEELLSALKSVFRGLELTDSHFYAQEDIVYRIDVIQDESKRKLANEVYKLCRKNYAVANPFIDVYAYRKNVA